MVESLNRYGRNKTPFLFIIDFEMSNPIIIPIGRIDNKKIRFNINGFKNYKCVFPIPKKEIIFKKFPMEYEKYECAFYRVREELFKGNSYLVNLTFPTEIIINLTLNEIFHCSNEKYRLLFDDYFVVFSPEEFISITGNKIYTFPMKGTIDAGIPGAREIILNDEKETAEHITIVDLLRNDLNMVSRNVTVENFRYIEEIRTNDKNLLQVSSRISGELGKNWNEKIGDILSVLLPAGSVTGAPKKKTVSIIKEVENYDRGYYTGVFGYFDGENLDSAVMIRFIEKINNKLYYKSGGGITIYSDSASEYNELKDKVYVPTVGNNQD